ncbi:MAG: 50S ribosomal protein L2 [candidate division TM6 bacterium GW2011_GWF2_43_17]|nr:MAG: 50S ribosomal protein L2 [candidate division TM6 bacterium GW2011_GWF2_43_17]HAU30141.1 50S ribosomal protein L2 [Candidatus Dependentiae bacterium]
MAIVRRKPRNASLRFQTFIDTSDLTKKKPERSLTKGLKRVSGRNAYGRITVRHRGGGAARKYRLVDFCRMDRDIAGKVVAIEYDPNRNVRIALIVYPNGRKRYILTPEGLVVGSVVAAGEAVDAQVGNCLPLRNMPIGFVVHNVEIRPGSGGKFARSAGTSVQLIAKEEGYATLRMPSGEMRKVNEACWATVGVLGNADVKNVSLGKAGRTRHRGFRPTVRGMVMNPVDHPMGGGEGRSKSGKIPQSPWGKNAKGAKTRRRKNALIIKRRK